jgi:hypothetical protein
LKAAHRRPDKWNHRFRNIRISGDFARVIDP